MELYDLLAKEEETELLNNEYCSKISMMDGEITENVYLLILHHYTLNNKYNKQMLIEGKELPYKAKYASKDEKGLKFVASNLPHDLQKIIVRYLKLVSN